MNHLISPAPHRGGAARQIGPNPEGSVHLPSRKPVAPRAETCARVPPVPGVVPGFLATKTDEHRVQDLAMRAVRLNGAG